MPARFTIPNDFGSIPASRRFSLSTKESRETVEGKRGLSIAELTKGGVFREWRTDAQYGFKYGDLEMVLVYDTIELDWYLKITNPGPKNRNNAITLTETKCHYGGTRHWFVCPCCERRCGVLYKDEDDFACRKCLDYGYTSQKINYRGLEPAAMRIKEFYEKAEKRFIYQSYKGKPTKRALRYEKLVERVILLKDTF